MRINIVGSYQDFGAGISYEGPESPVVRIQGNGNGWTKVTEGSVVIHGVPNRTTVHLSGANAWRIKGPETIG